MMDSQDGAVRKLSPLAGLVLGSICISFSPIFIRFTNVSPDIAGFYRMLFAGLSLLVVLCLRGSMKRVPRGPALLLLASGSFLSIDFMCWHRSIHLVGPGLSTLVANFQVFITAILAWLLFNEKISKMFVSAVVLAFCGLMFITGVDLNALLPDFKYGIGFGFLAAIFYSGYLLTLKESMQDPAVSAMSAMLVVSLVGTLVLGTVGMATGASFTIPDVGSLLALFGVGVLSTTIGWSMISSAVRHVPATVAGLVLLLQPALAFVWDIVIFNRPTGVYEVVGVVLILSAIYIGSRRT